MKSQYTLTELAVELERRASSKRDIIVDTRKLAMTEQLNGLVVPDMIQSNIHGGTRYAQEFGINNHAHQQIGARLGINKMYYDKMRAEAPELLAKNVNHWFEKQAEPRLVRILDGTTRAFLSDRYQRIENEEIANTVLPVLLESGQGVRIESCSVTDTKMYIKAVFPKVEGEVAKGDIVQAGIAISNSEVGSGTVKIEPLVFRLVCANGLIINDSKFSARHVGARISADEGLRELFSDETVQADDRAILLKVRDVVRASFDEARFARHLDSMRAASEDKITGNPAEAVKVLSKKMLLNEFESGSVLRHLIEGGDVSRWGVLNAVTRTAQDVESYDRANELESMGGVILNLPKTEWRVMAEAA